MHSLPCTIAESPVRVRDAWLRGGVEAVRHLIGLLALPLTDLYMGQVLNEAHCRLATTKLKHEKLIYLRSTSSPRLENGDGVLRRAGKNVLH